MKKGDASLGLVLMISILFLAIIVTGYYLGELIYGNEAEPEPMDEQELVQTVEPTVAPVEETPALYVVHPLSSELFRLTNEARTSRGLNELAYAYELQEAADARAYESSVQFSHTRPNGKPCHSVVDDYDYYVTGENLLRADAPLAVPEVMMSEWMLSEGHRANILLPEFTRLAVGIYEKNGVVYAAQIFLGV